MSDINVDSWCGKSKVLKGEQKVIESNSVAWAFFDFVNCLSSVAHGIMISLTSLQVTSSQVT